MSLDLPQKVQIRELICRDGFQNENFFVPTETKLYFIESLARMGLKWIEATSFSPPKYLPQFRDAEKVIERMHREKDITYNVITMNERALDRVLKTVEQGFGPDMILFMISTSENHHQRNGGQTHKQAWNTAKTIISRAKAHGLKVIGTIGTTFGCPIEGPVPIEPAFEFADRFQDLGVDELNFGDTTGEGTPDRVFDFYSAIVEKHRDLRLVAHFHESRGWGLANCLAAMQAGIYCFDSSMGGIGGQPADMVDGVPIRGTGEKYTPSDITGNVRSEDLVVMCDEMGIQTGIDIDAYLELGQLLERVVGRQLRSYCTKTGRIPKQPTGR